MPTPLIVGNWKMNKTASEAALFVKELEQRVRVPNGVEVVLAPPFTSLPAVRQALTGAEPFRLAAQNVHWEDGGAFTGEVAPPMLRDLGCDYVIIGHSERRQHFGEQDDHVNRKVAAALRHDLLPILCLGETLDQRERDQTDEIVTRQLTRGLDGLGTAEVAKVTVAYEPVWAIGTGRAATLEQAEGVHGLLQRLLTKLAGEAGGRVRVLYGGSVTPDNAAELLRSRLIHGALVGGACLKADSFAKIVSSAGSS